jgi:hypothetical protein
MAMRHRDANEARLDGGDGLHAMRALTAVTNLADVELTNK